MGKLAIVEHDGRGGLAFEDRPFVVMVDGAFEPGHRRPRGARSRPGSGVAEGAGPRAPPWRRRGGRAGARGRRHTRAPVAHALGVVPLRPWVRFALAALACQACARPAARPERAAARPERADARPAASSAPGDAPSALAPAPPAAETAPPASGGAAAALAPPEAPAARAIGPFEVPFAKGRTVYFAVPPRPGGPRRLIANLHGMCNPPAYACGYWLRAGAERGFVVCPTGNATCGPGASAPPTWTTRAAPMADDLERAVAAVDASFPGEISPEGAVLTGFSKGGYVAPAVAARRPGRFAYLLINEADVALDAASLRQSGVRAVALVAGELDSQVASERHTAAGAGLPREVVDHAQGRPPRLGRHRRDHGRRARLTRRA